MAGFTKHKMSDLAYERKLAKAQAMLDLQRLVDTDQVRKRFAEILKKAHPDTALEKTVMDIDLMRVRAAKDLLIKHLENMND